MPERAGKGRLRAKHGGAAAAFLEVADGGLDVVGHLICGLRARHRQLRQRTLLRRFKLERGETPLAFLQSVRIDRSKSLLAQTELGIAEIGARVGYHDVGTFRALFQRLIGMPPGAYRRRFKMAPSSAV